MSETIVGTPARYSTFTGTGSGTGTGTADEPFAASFGRIAIRAESQEELDGFVAWLSNMSGKPVDQLSEQDILRHVKVSDLSNCIKNGSTKSFSVKQAVTDSVDNFNDKEFFGETVPRFTAGTGAFIGAPLDLPPGTGMNASTAGFAATAQALYAANYSQEPGTPLSQAELDQLDPKVQALLNNMFGSGTPLSVNHLNVLKMMGLLTGKADQLPSTWTLTPTQGQALLNGFNEGSDTFINAMSLLNLRLDDVSLADGVRGYFNESGNFIQGFGTGNVEEVAGKLVKTMSPPETAMPGDIRQGENVAALMNNLLGLDPANTTFTVEQVNAALAMGLLSYDAGNKTINLTTNGQGYLTTKEAESAAPVTEPPVVVAALSIDEKADAFLSALLNLEGQGNVFEIFDEGRDGKNSDGKISREDIEAHARRDPYNNDHWKNDHSRIPIELRVKIVALARYAVDNGVVEHLFNNQNAGQRYDSVIENHRIRGHGDGGPIDWYVAALPADRPTLHFEQVGNGYTNTARVVEKRGDQVVTS